MSKKVRIGIIGAGVIGEFHLKALATVPQAQVVALADPRTERLEQLRAAHGIAAAFADPQEMLKKAATDAVFVCTPNFLHAEHTLAALRAGNHVFCEKPMALNAVEAQKMASAARRAKKLLQMGMVWRHKAESQGVKQYIDGGALGEIYHIRVVLLRRRGVPGLGGWFTTRAQSGGGCLIDVGVHILDLVMWLTDNWKPTTVSAATYNKFGSRMKDYVYTNMWAGPPRYDGVCDVDDYAAGFVRFGKKTSLSFEISWAVNTQQDEAVELLGDKGGARMVSGKPLAIFSEANGHIIDAIPHVAEYDPYEKQMANFVNAVLGKEPPLATGEQGVAVMKLLDRIYRSAETAKEA